jgi:hypothetical protein
VAVEIHPNYGSFLSVRKVVEYIDDLGHLSDAQKHTILMEALDLGAVSIPADQVPSRAAVSQGRELTAQRAHEIADRAAERTAITVAHEFQRRGFRPWG